MVVTTTAAVAAMALDLTIDKGDTAFMFISTALVQFMTPGLAFFYGGSVSVGNTVDTFFKSMVAMGVVLMLWYTVVFSLAFGPSVMDYGLIGDPMTFLFFKDVSIYKPLVVSGAVVGPGSPGILYAMFQGMFAMITPALISGAFAGRFTFGPYLVFICLWMLFVYAPLAHWNWGGGWMYRMGSWDFAGGIVVHESSGFSALAAVFMLGKKDRHGKEKKPHNLPFMVLGTSILFFGWFGFNCGSALISGGLASVAFQNTHLAASAGLVSWVFLDWLFTGKAKLQGACVGCVAGLVVITPAAGFIQSHNAVLCGFLAALVCRKACMFMESIEWDDAADVFGCHGVGGFLGTILTGVLADPEECGDKATAPHFCVNPGTIVFNRHQITTQIIVAVSAAVYSVVMTVMIIKLLSIFAPTMHTPDDPDTQDVDEYGEDAYNFGFGDDMKNPKLQHSANGQYDASHSHNAMYSPAEHPHHGGQPHNSSNLLQTWMSSLSIGR